MTASQTSYQKAYERERKARLEAETLLEDKTREVFEAFGTLRDQYELMASQQTRLEMAASVGKFAQSEPGARENIQFLIEKGCELCGANYGGLFLFNADQGSPVYFSDISHADGPASLRVGNHVRTYYHRQSVFLHKLFTDGRAVRKEHVTEGAGPTDPNFAVLLPVPSFGSVACVLLFGITGAELDPDDFIDLVRDGVDHLGVVLQRSEAQRGIQENYAHLQAAYNEVREVQGQLAQSEKMASLGQLAAGVAHEINNPVGFVLSNVGTLADYVLVFIRALKGYEKMAAEIEHGRINDAARLLENVKALAEEEDLPFIIDDVKDVISESERGLQRVREIVSGLKSFARVDEAQFKHADINECLDSTLKIASSEIRYKCEVNTDFGELPEIMCNPGQLNQVFLNLLMNAGQAIEEHGVISITSRVEDEHILVIIEDNGSGIDEKHLIKLFTPFFTTKDVGVGTGLGLSISYGIIKKHGGDIKVTSEVGKGTRFVISLPLAGVPEATLRERMGP